MPQQVTGSESARSDNAAQEPQQDTTTTLGTPGGGSRNVELRLSKTRSVTIRIDHRQQKD